MYREENVCPVCGKRFNGMGNNGYPIVKGSVCDDCNKNLIEPVRMGIISREEAEKIILGNK